jgi:hypothetical protein
MEQGPRFFTVEEANALVSTLEVEFGRLARLRSELGPLIASLGGADASVAILQDGAAGPPGRKADAERLRRVAAEITAGIERVNALGCLVKDVDAGLVDFHAMLDGEPVLLCWQFGEPAVAHWHTADEGFAGRKPIDGVTVEWPEFMN